MDFLELVTGARTCRRFREAEGMPAGMLDWLIECARVTPCGGNAQALRFAVAESPEACAAVFPALKWAGMLTDWDGPEAGERPSGYVAILGEAGTRAKLNAIDAGIAAQTIQLGRIRGTSAAAFSCPLIRARSARCWASPRTLSRCSYWRSASKRKSAALKPWGLTAP